MKRRLVFALTGLAISLAVPTFAQQNGTAVSKIVQQIRALAIRYEEAYNKHDPPGVAALFTEDGVRVTATGTCYDRPAIEKSFAKYDFQRWHVTDLYKRLDRVIMVGNEVSAHGIWG
jgi:uncharacterized protein (TIGR02246 family)